MKLEEFENRIIMNKIKLYKIYGELVQKRKIFKIGTLLFSFLIYSSNKQIHLFPIVNFNSLIIL